MFNFKNTYKDLGGQFYSATNPAKTTNPQLLIKNQQLLTNLNLASLNDNYLTQVLSGNQVEESSTPIAMVYAGHQFGHFNPQLGDGRALLLGEIFNENSTLDVSLKGSGRTKYSRGGDGKLALGPGIREYLISEFMHNAGIPTTRSLALIATGDEVMREMPLPAAVLTRVLASNIRIGSFEYFANLGDKKSIQKLANYAINRHYPQLNNVDNKYLKFFQAVAKNQAKLVAKWLSIGFIHGVLNTDNTTISGETIDYGPCAFMDNYKPNKVFSSIDRNSRYAYNNQANILAFNLNSLGFCLAPLIDKSQQNIEMVLQNYSEDFNQNYNQIMASKIGLNYQNGDEGLIDELLKIMNTNNLDWTNFFRSLANLKNDYNLGAEFDAWFIKWQQRLLQENSTQEKTIKLMNGVNPVIIARNHQVQKAIDLAYSGDFSGFYELNTALSSPFEYNEKYQQFYQAPAESEKISQTFCGT